jgi:hypothetical protein
VGCEGVVGAMAGLGLYKSLVRVVVQLPIGVTKYRPLNSEKQPPQVMQFATSAYNIMRSFYLRRA